LPIYKICTICPSKYSVDNSKRKSEKKCLPISISSFHFYIHIQSLLCSPGYFYFVLLLTKFGKFTLHQHAELTIIATEIEKRNNGQKCDSFLVPFWGNIWGKGTPKESHINKATFNANWTIYANFIAKHFFIFILLFFLFILMLLLLLLVGLSCYCHMWQSACILGACFMPSLLFLCGIVAPKRLLNQAI